MRLYPLRFLSKCFFAITLFLLFAFQLFAQSYSIKGTITDTLNNPLQYINVTIIGTAYGDASDENGNYEISNLKAGT